MKLKNLMVPQVTVALLLSLVGRTQAVAGDFIDIVTVDPGLEPVYAQTFEWAAKNWEYHLERYSGAPNQRMTILADMLPINNQLNPQESGVDKFGTFIDENNPNKTYQTPVESWMVFDRDEFPPGDLIGTGGRDFLYGVQVFRLHVMHEIGHTLGFGLAWKQNGLLEDVLDLGPLNPLGSPRRIIPVQNRVPHLAQYVGEKGVESYFNYWMGTNAHDWDPYLDRHLIEQMVETGAFTKYVPSAPNNPNRASINGNWVQGGWIYDKGRRLNIAYDIMTDTPVDTDMYPYPLLWSNLTIASMQDVGWVLVEPKSYPPIIGTGGGTPGPVYPPVVPMAAPDPLYGHSLVASRVQLQTTGFELLSRVHDDKAGVENKPAGIAFGRSKTLLEKMAQDSGFANEEDASSSRASAAGQPMFEDDSRLFSVHQADRDERVRANIYYLDFERDGKGKYAGADGDSLEAMIGYERGFEMGAIGVGVTWGTHSTGADGDTYKTGNDTDSFGIVGWGRYEYDKFFVSGVVAFRWLEMETEYQDLLSRYTGSTNGVQTLMGLQIGKDYQIDETSFLTPYLGVDLSYSKIDGYTEEETNGLTFSDMDMTSVRVAFGGRWNQKLYERWDERLTWRVGLAGSVLVADNGDSGYAREAVTGVEWTVQVLEMDDYDITPSLGMTYELKRFAVELDAGYTWGENSTQYFITGGASYKF